MKSTFAYDDLNELTASCPAGRVQADACDPSVPSTSSWRQTYDVAGHVIDSIPPVNATAAALVTTTSVYDTTSGGARLTRTCDHPAGASSCTAASRYTDYLYDNLGRQVRSTTYAGAPTGTEKLKTVTTYDAAGEQTQLDYTENGAGSPTDTLAFGYDLLGRQSTVSRGGSAITTSVYNADGTVATRADAAISATAAGFGYDPLGNLTTATSPLYTGSATFSWGLDSLITGRTWPGTADAATYSYDGAKRPAQYAETASGSALATLSRGYDRMGSVNSETQVLAGVSGYAGGTAQTMSYDQLGRVTGSTLGTITRAYTYDPDSNRLSATENGTTTTYTYDRADELTTQKVGAGTTRQATYDAYGNLVSEPNPDGTATFTTYAYNSGDVLTGQTPASGSGAVSYTIDALGRHRSQTGGGLTDTYSYAGSGSAVVQITNASSTTNSAIDALGSRLATTTSAGGFGWLIPDLHRDIAAAANAAGTAITDAFRYDPYGKVVASATSSLPTPWRYQGRLLESSGSDPALYDFGFRPYDTSLGAFTSLDDVAGSALNPITFNRFLYAGANPETLVDPSGHYPPPIAVAQILSNAAADSGGLQVLLTVAGGLIDPEVIPIGLAVGFGLGVATWAVTHPNTSTGRVCTAWRLGCSGAGPTRFAPRVLRPTKVPLPLPVPEWRPENRYEPGPLGPHIDRQTGLPDPPVRPPRGPIWKRLLFLSPVLIKVLVDSFPGAPHPQLSAPKHPTAQ